MFPEHPDFFMQREHSHHESVHYFIEHRTARGRQLISRYTAGTDKAVDSWGRGAKARITRAFHELVEMVPQPEELPQDLLSDEVLELGIWCHYEGAYDAGEYDTTRGHYGYPCDHPEEHVQVAVVLLPTTQKEQK